MKKDFNTYILLHRKISFFLFKCMCVYLYTQKQLSRVTIIKNISVIYYTYIHAYTHIYI